ncbi:hypothetical protein KAR34_05300 [bacterium]|nr:hypothetical protein [bacterium]
MKNNLEFLFLNLKKSVVLCLLTLLLLVFCVEPCLSRSGFEINNDNDASTKKVAALFKKKNKSQKNNTVKKSIYIKPEKRAEVSKYAKVYTGYESVEVTTLRYGPRKNNEALVLIQGIDHEWDGKIILHKIIKKPDEIMMKRTGDEKEWVTIVNPTDNYSNETILLSIPKYQPKKICLKYNAKKSKNTKPKHILTQYLDQ